MSIEKKVLTQTTKESEVIIRGWLKEVFKENHRLKDHTVIYESCIRTVDFWGNIKPEIPLQIDGRFLKKLEHDFRVNEFVEVQGEIRTKNVYDEEGNKIQRRCYVFIKSIESLNENASNPQNHVCIRGLMARKGKIHHCKNGDSMFDFTLDIRRSRGRRSSIPCVIWGKDRAQLLANVAKNADVEVDGWLKTRIITDSLGITKMVTEIIVDNFNVYREI